MSNFNCAAKKQHGGGGFTGLQGYKLRLTFFGLARKWMITSKVH